MRKKRFKDMAVGTKLVAISLSILTLLMAGAFAVVIILTMESTQTNAAIQMEALAQGNAADIDLEIEA